MQAALYAPGATLDPACAPTDSNCGIASQIGSGATGQVPYYAAAGTSLTATSTFTILANGNTGVGTTTPYALFSINGKAGGTSDIFAVATSSASNATTTALRIDSNGNLYLPGGNGLNIGYGTTAPPANGMIIAGNFGIGTSSPFVPLSVAGNGYFSGSLNVGNTTTTRANLGLRYASNTEASYPSYNVVAWGDSLVGGGAGAVPFTIPLSTDLGNRPVSNQGVGGQTSTQIATRMLAAPTKSNWTVVIWAGANNTQASSTVEADIASMVASMGSNTHYVILSILNGTGEGTGTTAYNQIIVINSYLAATYPGHYFDIRGYLIQSGLSAAGITPTSQDLTDISNDIVPTSLRGDAIHPNTAANQVIATQLANFITTNLDTSVSSSVLSPQSLPSIFANAFSIGTNNQSTGFFSKVAIATSSTSTPSAALDVYGPINTNSSVGGYYMDGAPLLSSSSTVQTYVLGGSIGPSYTGFGNTIFGSFLSVTSGNNNTVFGRQAFTHDTTGSDNIAAGAFALAFQTTGNQNIGIGTQSLFNNITGSGNVAIGFFALSTATTTSDETAIGWKTLQNEVSGTFGHNTAIGYQVLAANTYGIINTGVGRDVLANNTTGSNNTAVGSGVLAANTTGSNNVGVGDIYTLAQNTSGSFNVGIGSSALTSNTIGQYNVAIGASDNTLNGPLNNNTTGQYNIVLGTNALKNSSTGSFNIALGGFALGVNTAATNTVAIGYRAAFGGNGNGTAYTNQGGTVIGYQAGQLFQTGSDYNTLFGYQAGNGITTGARNVLIGQSTILASQNQVTTGSNNIAIGNDVAVPSATASNQLSIGNFIYGTGLSGTGLSVSPGSIGIGTTTPWRTLSVAGTVALSGLTTDSADSKTLCLTAGGEVVANAGTSCITSSERFKNTIEPLATSSGLDEVLQLNPVSFAYNADIGIPGTQVGFIAEQVNQVDPRLVVLDASSTPFTVRYENLTAVLAKAIQEIAAIGGTFQKNLIAWLGSAGNGITDFFATTVHTQNLCVKRSDGSEICITGDQLNSVLNQSGQQGAAAPAAAFSAPIIITDIPAPAAEAASSTDHAATSTPDTLATPTDATAATAEPSATTTVPDATATPAQSATDSNTATTTATKDTTLPAPAAAPAAAGSDTAIQNASTAPAQTEAANDGAML